MVLADQELGLREELGSVLAVAADPFQVELTVEVSLPSSLPILSYLLVGKGTAGVTTVLLIP